MQQPLDRLLTLSALPNRTPDEEVELQRLAHQTEWVPLAMAIPVIKAMPDRGGQLVIGRKRKDRDETLRS